MKNKRLYNVIFPVWMLWLIPTTWIVVLPANFLIDLAVVLITLQVLHISEKKEIAKRVIWKVWGFGFLADLIGTFFMFLPTLMDFDFQTPLGKWWYENLVHSVSFNPFTSVYAMLWVMLCVLVAGFFIYLFNYKVSFRNVDLAETVKKKLALSLAIFTAPYLFYLPTMLFYRGL